MQRLNYRYLLHFVTQYKQKYLRINSFFDIILYIKVSGYFDWEGLEMKNRILSLILSLAIFTLMLPEVVSTANSFGVSDGFTYELTNEFSSGGLEAVIWGYTGSEERVVIPERVGGIIVRAVRTLRMVGTGVTGDAAYGAEINENVKTVVIPPVVKYLDGKMKAGNIENIVFAPRTTDYSSLEIKYNAEELKNWDVSLNYTSAEEKTVVESLSTNVFAGKCKSSGVYYKTGDFTYRLSTANATVVASDEKESRIEVPETINDTSGKTLPVVGIKSVSYDLSYEEDVGYKDGKAIRTETIIISDYIKFLSGYAHSGGVNNFVFRPRTDDIEISAGTEGKFKGSKIYLHYINDGEKAIAKTLESEFAKDDFSCTVEVHPCIRNKPCTEVGKYICSTDCEACTGIEFGGAPTEEHDITYSLDSSNNAKIIAKCKKEGDKTEVSHLTLKAPGELTGGSYIVIWDGASKPATFDNLEAFNSATKNSFTVGDISYYRKGETQSLGSAPRNEGEYVAKFTVGEATAEMSFEITKIVLPSTGGIGTGLFTAVGVILMGVAGVLFLILKKKK